MNIIIVTKKRKYLLIQLACASSSNWSSMYSGRGCGCNNGIDVLITSSDGWFSSCLTALDDLFPPNEDVVLELKGCHFYLLLFLIVVQAEDFVNLQCP